MFKRYFSAQLGALAAGLLLATAAWAQQSSQQTPPKKASNPAAAKGAKKAEAPAPQVQRFDDWAKVCPPPAQKGDKPVCRVEQAVRAPDAPEGSVLFVWRIAKTPEGRYSAAVITPNRTLLPAGVTFQFVADKQTVLPYRSCDQGFCEVTFNLEEDLLKSMASRDAMAISFRMADNRIVNINLSLKGLGAAIGAL